MSGETFKPIQDCYDLIEELRPSWVIASHRAKRDGYQNATLNEAARESFHPINALLDEVLELRLIVKDGIEITVRDNSLA